MEQFRKVRLDKKSSATISFGPTDMKVSSSTVESEIRGDMRPMPINKNQSTTNNTSNQIFGKQCDSENMLMRFKRWKKIEEDFVWRTSGPIQFDITKLPEICDNIVYDMIHYPEDR